MPMLELNDDHNDGRSATPVQVREVCIQPGKPHLIWWVIAVSLAVIAVTFVLRIDGGFNRPAFAQSPVSAGAHGVFAFSGQVSKNAYGVYMVDVDAGTIWCYRFDQGSDKLKLVAGRNWNYDRRLSNHSTEPPPDFIKTQLEKEQLARQQAGGRP